MNELGMLLEKIDTLEDVTKERDIYRQAIVDFLDASLYEAPDMKILVDALGKKRMKND